MSGNVWEWCWNWFTTEYSVEFEGGYNPTGSPIPSLALSESNRIVRGESLCDNNFSGISRRGATVPLYIYNNNGLRLVRTITE